MRTTITFILTVLLFWNTQTTAQQSEDTTQKAGSNSSKENVAEIPIRRSDDKQLTPLEKEAAKALINTMKIRKIGDSYYINIPEQLSKAIVEFKKMELKISTDELNEVDELNGLKWKGSISIKSKACRGAYKYETGPNPKWGPWSEWKGSFIRLPVPDGHLMFQILRVPYEVRLEKKKDNKWTFIYSMAAYRGEEMITIGYLRWGEVDPSDIKEIEASK